MIGRIQQLWSIVLVVGGPVAAWIDYCRPPYKVCSEEQLHAASDERVCYLQKHRVWVGIHHHKACMVTIIGGIPVHTTAADTASIICPSYTTVFFIVVVVE